MKVQEEYARVIEREDFRSCLKILPHAIEILHGTLGNQQNQGVLCSMLSPQLGCPIQHALLPTRVSYLTCFSSIGRIETSPPIQGVLFFQPVPLPLVELRPLPQGVLCKLLHLNLFNQLVLLQYQLVLQTANVTLISEILRWTPKFFLRTQCYSS